jgi:hypothetical protein
MYRLFYIATTKLFIKQQNGEKNAPVETSGAFFAAAGD